jgi:tape measure domain-containing protein
MAAIRELVTYLRYKVDTSGLKQYVKDADKAAADVNKAVKKTQEALPKTGPQGQRIINVPGQGPGYFDTTSGGARPKFVPITPASAGGAGPAFRMPNPEQIAIAERGAARAAMREAEREANAEARAQQQVAMAERSAQRQAARQEAMQRRQQERAEALAARQAARQEAALARVAERNRQAAIGGGRGAISGFGGGIGGIIGPALAALGIHEITHIADEWSTVNARIGLVTANTKEQRDVLDQIYAISNRTRQSYEETANLVFNMRQATEHAGISMKDTLSAAENFNKALIVGGGTAANNRRAIYELNHALESGHLGGMQLRSLRMEAPIFTRTLTNELAGGDGAKFQEMAKKGLITTKVIIDALNKATDDLNKKFTKMPLTIGQATTVAGNMFGKLVNDIGQASGAFSDFAHMIVWATSTFIDSVRGIADAVGGFSPLIKLIEILVAAFAGTKLIMGLNAIAEAFEAGGIAAAIAEAPFLIIFGILVAIGLVVEDIWGTINGKKSLTGDIFDAVASQLVKIQNAWPAVEAKITSGFEAIGKFIDKWLVQPLETAFDWLTKVTNALGLNTGPDTGANPQSGAGGWGKLGKVGTGIQNALNSSFASGGGGGGTYLSPDGQVIHVTNNINTADNPNSVATAAERGTRQGVSTASAGRAMGNSYPSTEAK